MARRTQYDFYCGALHFSKREFAPIDDVASFHTCFTSRNIEFRGIPVMKSQEFGSSVVLPDYSPEFSAPAQWALGIRNLESRKSETFVETGIWNAESGTNLRQTEANQKPKDRRGLSGTLVVLSGRFEYRMTSAKSA